jgi:hypothetical protein
LSITTTSLVLVCHGDADRLGRFSSPADRGASVDLDRLAALHLHRAGRVPAVDAHVALLDRPREAAAGLAGHERRERAVQAKARELERNHQLGHGIIPA